MDLFVRFIILFLILSVITFFISYAFGNLKKHPKSSVVINFLISLTVSIGVICL